MFFYPTLIFTVVTVFLFLVSGSYWRWIVMGLAILFLIKVVVSWFDCHGAAGLSETGGETCPKCRKRSPVFPWSF